jgi:hypothetical protein
MYAPNFSPLAAVTVRRLAWAMGSTMGKAVDVMAKSLPGFINPEKVCASCKDKTKCAACAFKNGGEMPQKALALLYTEVSK